MFGGVQFSWSNSRCFIDVMIPEDISISHTGKRPRVGIYETVCNSGKVCGQGSWDYNSGPRLHSVWCSRLGWTSSGRMGECESYSFPAMWPWARPLLSLSLSLLICITGALCLPHSAVEMIRCVHTCKVPGSEKSTCTHT